MCSAIHRYMNYTTFFHPEIKEIRIYSDEMATSQGCASYIADRVGSKPDLVVSYATGNSKIAVYQEISKFIESGTTDFSNTYAFHLDEYFPCNPTEPYSFVKYLTDLVYRPFHIAPERIFSLNGEAQDPKQEALHYEELIARHPIELSILGIGPGCHIGFNERGTSFSSRTHLAQLCKETVERDQKERGQSSPESALTQGIGTILDSKEILLVCYGTKYAELLRESLLDPISEDCPASALRNVGEKVKIFIDQEAASFLK